MRRTATDFSRKGERLIMYLFFLTCITLASSAAAFLAPDAHSLKCRLQSTALSSEFKMSAEKFDNLNSLSSDERTVVSVVRSCGPSVGYVTSIVPNRMARNTSSRSVPNGLPRGFGLGSGSCFIVDTTSAGNATYLATNYHVIEQAYELQAMAEFRRRVVDEIAGNLTTIVPNELSDFFIKTASFFNTRTTRALPPDPEVYVRVNSATRFQKCRIVGVDPNFDLAVLCFEATDSIDSFKALDFGSSTDLVVGQDLIAIGNPFGLDSTVTTGVVSALGRSVTTAPRRQGAGPNNSALRNCIQTDCAINPGNSGGPLLNRKSQVVGMNTAILSTSGSSAGIGFAVPSDAIQDEIRTIIRKDARRFLKRGTIGVAIVKTTEAFLKESKARNWISRVVPDSPAAKAGMIPVKISSGSIQAGEAIVAIGSKTVSTFRELQNEVSRCVPGEQLSVTLEDVSTRERRIVYVRLE